VSEPIKLVPKYWVGTPETVCNICDRPIDRVFIDGRTRQGPWAIMCPGCAANVGTGLGPARGQRYEQQGDGRWLKTA
jgi:hypothetical protein